MPGYESLLELYAELSLALIGFAGVAAAFGGIKRSYSPTERGRLTGMFHSAGTVFAGCIALLALPSLAVSPSTAAMGVSVAAFAFVTMNAVGVLPSMYRWAASPEASTEPWVAVIVTIYFAVVLGLYVVDLFLGGPAWPVVVAFSIHLVLGLWMFTRILTHR